MTPSASTVPSPSLQLAFTLVPADSRDSPTPSKTSTALFLRFEELQGLQHPNLARYLELLLARDGLVFIASEHSSLSLKAALAHQPAGFSSQKALQISAQLVRGLCYLNSRGLVHARLDSTTVIFQEKVTEQHCDVLLTGHGRPGAAPGLRSAGAESADAVGPVLFGARSGRRLNREFLATKLPARRLEPWYIASADASGAMA